MTVRIIVAILLCTSLVLMTACGSGNKSDTQLKSYSLSGVAQKGPAQQGTNIVLYQLNRKAERTGRTVTTKIIGKQGAFAFQIPSHWEVKEAESLLEVVLTGYFFDESTGNDSSTPVQLSAFSSVGKNQQVSVNILTTLLVYRVRQLMSHGEEFATAQQSAAISLQEITGVSANIATKTDITRLSYPKENALLLFLSGSISELAQQYNVSVQRIIDQLAADFALDGQLSGIGEQWEQRLSRMSLNQEVDKTEKYAAHLHNYLERAVTLPNGSHLPKLMRITSRPSANAGEDQIVPSGKRVTLNGLQSKDVEEKAVKYTWFQTNQDNNAVILSDRFIASPQFNAPEKLDQTLWFTLVVTDARGVTDTDTVKISTAEFLPTIDDLPEIIDETGNSLNNTIRVNEGETVALSLLVNNPLNKNLQYSLRSPTSNGTVKFPAQGAGKIAEVAVSYTHNGSETQADAFTFAVVDARNNSASKRVDIIIIPVNDAPVAQEDQVITLENQSVNINVLVNDTDPESDKLSLVAITKKPQHGNVTIIDDVITYLPDTAYIGEDNFTYELTDGDKTATANVSVIVTEKPNTAPSANNDSAVTLQDQPVTINILNNDSDPDNDSLSATISTQPENGTALVNNEGLVIYTPNIGFSGTDRFIYTVNDGRGGEDAAEVTMTVSSVNGLPNASNDFTITNQDESITIPALGNDSDPENDTLTIISTTTPVNGFVNINNGITITYTPDSSFSGTDSFSYTISDGQGGTATAVVRVQVNAINESPTANDDSANAIQGSSVIISVLNNDSDPENDSLTITSTTTPANGSATINNATSITYTPNASNASNATFSGTDSFSYTISDGQGGSDTASVTIQVNALNQAPTAGDDTASVNQGGSVIISVLGNDSDPENNTLTISSATTPAHGSVTINNAATITYTSDASYTGSTDSFTYTITDGQGGTDTASVQIEVNTIVNQAPTAGDDAASVNQGSSVTISVLDNDSDPENNTLTITSVTTPAHGSVTINNAATITYTSDASYTGSSDSFTYTITDGQGGTDTASVQIEVNTIVNQAPTAGDDAASVNQGSSVTISVLGNDSDPENNTLTITSVTTPAHGSVTINNGTTITYTSEANYTGSTDGFNYTISDGQGGSDTASVSIEVNTINQLPIAVDDAFSAGGSISSVIGNVLENDSDPDGDAIEVIPFDGNLNNGSLSLSASGDFTYIPNSTLISDVFVYTLKDSRGATDTATLTITQ